MFCVGKWAIWCWIFNRDGPSVRTLVRKALLAGAVTKESYGRAFGFEWMMDTLGAIVGPATAFFLIGIFNHHYPSLFAVTLIPSLIAVGLLGASDFAHTLLILLATVNGVGDFRSSIIAGALWTALGTSVAFGYSAVLFTAGALLILRLRTRTSAR